MNINTYIFYYIIFIIVSIYLIEQYVEINGITDIFLGILTNRERGLR